MNIVVTIALSWVMLVALALAFGYAASSAGQKLARRRGESAALAVLAIAATLCAQKAVTTRWTFDSYVQDAGCWASNSTVHVSLAQRVPGIDLSGSPVLLYAREIGVADPEAWTELLPRRTFAELPADYALANATNHDFTVFVDYVPPPTVHTNGVWQMRGIELGRDADAARYAFPNTAVADKREIVPIEYLESTGTQYIDTGIYPNGGTDWELCMFTPRDVNQNAFGSRNVSSGMPAWGLISHGSGHWSINRLGSSWNTQFPRRVGTVNVYAFRNGVATYNGEPKGTFSGNVQVNYPAIMFGYNSGGRRTLEAVQGILCCKIWQDGILVRDFIPVRVGNVGYMYDRVSGEYLPYGNKGTGSFVLGPDKNE